MQKKDIMINETASTAVINLGLTKGGQRQGVLEHITLDHPGTVRMLAASLLHLLPGDFVVGTSAANFRSVFKESCVVLGLSEWGFKPYSLRRGGATHHFREGGSLSLTVLKGRWLSSKSARLYINDGLATLATF